MRLQYFYIAGSFLILWAISRWLPMVDADGNPQDLGHTLASGSPLECSSSRGVPGAEGHRQ